MVQNADPPDADESGPPAPDLDGVTGYEDGDQFVIRDEDDPDAWIRADLVRELSP